MKRRIFAAGIAAAMALQLTAAVQAAEVGENLTVDKYEKSAAETQKLIDNRPDIQRPMENIGRGLIAVKSDKSAFVSWRWLGTESLNVKYNLYRNGEKINAEPLNVTNYIDINTEDGAKYSVSAVTDGVEGEKCSEVTLLDKSYIEIPIQQPQENSVNGEKYTYSAGDASVGDLDGDGEYEIVLKWDPSNAKDAAQMGYTGECIIDAYEMDGTLMWRVNMGPNIRAGAHDTQFMVYDFDGDGKAEMACRTADGTIAGDGAVIGDAEKNWAALDGGKNLKGPLYLTVFEGETGKAIDTVDYDPQSVGKDYDITDWGDAVGNRSERYLADVAYLDGVHPSMVFCRGYYTGGEGPLGGRTVIATFNLVDGKIVKNWTYDSKEIGNMYIGQGNHSMSAADVDYDGCDEIIYGSLAVDNDGKALYSTQLGHGDAQHVGDLDPSRPGLEVYSCHEDTNSAYGYEMRDARTGEILYGEKTASDNGRGTSDDIDPNYPGCEGWSAAGVLTAADGTVISTSYTMPANFLAWWDGDLGREIQDNIYISKWNGKKQKAETIFTASGCREVNGTKANPSLTADLFGDWREEVIYPAKDEKSLRVYTTTTTTGYRLPTLMHDIQYRLHVAAQNTCYNQPTHTSYYLGYDTKNVPVPQIYVTDNNDEVRNPDLSKKTWDIKDLYSGEKVELVIGCPTALINGAAKRIDNDNTEVVPYISAEDRTLVPLRFISEAFGAEVDWNQDTQTVTITLGKRIVKMVIGNTDYEVTTAKAAPESKQMETAPVIAEDRTMVPVRAVAEAIERYVYFNNGLITISDIENPEFTDAEAKARLEAIKTAPVPERIEVVALNSVGEKYYPNQLDVYAVEASGNDGNLEIGAVDLDMSTRWSSYGPSTLVLDLGSVCKATGVSIACWKGNERVYPFVIEYSVDGDNWKQALGKSQNTGENDGFEKFMFPEAVEARYIRYNGDGATDPKKNYCHISEIAVLGAEE
ncbi:MAG: stalk domain-containing protein [Clostridia bacterium]|nr:stalk domain-containing protein [Clostridia bacterium]